MAIKAELWDPKMETISWESLRKLQEKRLKEQIDYVYRNSEFYQEKYKSVGLEPGDIKKLEDLEKIPFTEKDELRKGQEVKPPFGTNLCIPPEEVVWAPSTSGTTGVPLILPRNRQDIETWIDLDARAFWRTGLRKNDVFQNILGYHWIYSGLMHHWAAERIGACVIPAGMGNTDKQIWCLLTLKVTAVLATPSYFLYLGSRLAERGLADKVNPRLLTGGGEIGLNTKEGKEKIRMLFPTADIVTDLGGVTDIGTVIWGECQEESGSHLCEDAILTEVLDLKTKKPVGPGYEGELVFTDLVSKTAPLIRYRVKDLTSYDLEPCPCGRTHGRLPRGVFGRVDDMITVRSGNIYPMSIESIVKSINGLNGEYQIVIDRPRELDRLTIRAEYNQDTTNQKEIESEIKSRMRILVGSSVEVELLPPGKLPRFAYKAKRVVDMRKGETYEDVIRKAQEQERM